MKKTAFIFGLFLAFTAFSHATFAQTTAPTQTAQVKPGRAMLSVPSLTTEEQFQVLQSSVLNKLDGIAMSNFNFNNKQLILMYDLNKIGVDKVIEVLAQNGYPATIYIASDKPRATTK